MQESPPAQAVVALQGAPYSTGSELQAISATKTESSPGRKRFGNGTDRSIRQAAQRIRCPTSAMSTLGRLGPYELVRKIAAGGMAEIFLARHWGPGGFFRDVVIKRLFRHLAENPKQLRMFQDEARLLAALSHPNIPQVYEIGSADGYWFIAMEYVDGPTVADAVQLGVRNGIPLPVPVAIGIVMQTCEALHHAHERADRARRPLRIVHRDVTPQNVMLTRDGVAKLMDFGIASTAARKESEAGAVRGTFSYMAPEQIRARPLDKRADVFALGVILYELTTGTRLFRGSDVQVMTQVVEQDVPPPSSRVADYPADLEQIVLHTLARDRGRRVPSTAHLAQRLEELAQRNGILVGPRAVARWVGQVLPAERLREEELAMVAPPPEFRADAGNGFAGPPAGDDAAEVLPEDREAILEELNLLSLPPDALEDAGDDLPDALRDLPDALRGLASAYGGRPGGLEPTGDDGLIDLGASVDDLLGIDEAPLTLQPPSSGGAAEREPLVLDGFDEGDALGPVLLLDAPKRPTKAPPSGSAFVDELERKLIAEDELLEGFDEGGDDGGGAGGGGAGG
jgi:serine/threonine protein kinase